MKVIHQLFDKATDCVHPRVEVIIVVVLSVWIAVIDTLIVVIVTNVVIL